MSGRKLSSKAEEEVVFMEQLLARCDALARPIEEYAAAKKGGDQFATQVVRALQEMRQHAMQKNLGPIADAAGVLSVQCARGSVIMRARTMREGVAGYKQLIERMMKALVEADARQQHEKEVEMQRSREAEKAAGKRIAERALRDAEEAEVRAKAKAAAAAAPQATPAPPKAPPVTPTTAAPAPPKAPPVTTTTAAPAPPKAPPVTPTTAAPAPPKAPPAKSGS